ncbi:MAG: hypothetical protein RLZZ490_2112 [Cyanobacteriota bacterium]|jgi:hypothetical protein
MLDSIAPIAGEDSTGRIGGCGGQASLEKGLIMFQMGFSGVPPSVAG